MPRVVTLAGEPGLEKGDKCIFWLSNMIFLASFQSLTIQFFESRRDRGGNRLVFRLLAAVSGNEWLAGLKRRSNFR